MGGLTVLFISKTIQALFAVKPLKLGERNPVDVPPCLVERTVALASTQPTPHYFSFITSVVAIIISKARLVSVTVCDFSTVTVRAGSAAGVFTVVVIVIMMVVSISGRYIVWDLVVVSVTRCVGSLAKTEPYDNSALPYWTMVPAQKANALPRTLRKRAYAK